MRLEMMKGKYWHKLSKRQKDFLRRKHVTIGWIVKHLKQPDWCTYPEALSGNMGCWSLTAREERKIKITKEYCSRCNCYQGY